MVRIFELIAQVVIILTLICPRLSLAEEGSSNWVNTDNTSVRLFVANLEPKINSKKLLVGLHFKLKDGWKIYWRSPGDAGYPPKLNWNQSIHQKDPRDHHEKVLDHEKYQWNELGWDQKLQE